LLDYGAFLNGVVAGENLDGGGRMVAPVFEAALRGRRFGRCFECCAGPGWIGLWLLANGIVGELEAGDINPAAVRAIAATASANGLAVKAYESDNLRGASGKFDLIVSNHPSYCNIQTTHPLGFLRDDLRPMDDGWRIHRDFYGMAAEYLAPGGEIWTVEVEPFKADVYLGGKLYDKRPKPPIIDFAAMMTDGGLMLDEVMPFKLGDVQMALLKTRAI
jgi:hypothetical protein